MILYEGIHHVALVVTDLIRAKRFYEQVLGLRESTERPAFDFGGAWYEVGVMQVHLIVHADGKTARGTTAIDTRDGHFALRVTDMRAVLERLDEQGIAYKNNPHSITGWHQVFITDPDGNVIELNAMPLS